MNISPVYFSCVRVCVFLLPLIIFEHSSFILMQRRRKRKRFFNEETARMGTLFRILKYLTVATAKEEEENDDDYIDKNEREGERNNYK